MYFSIFTVFPFFAWLEHVVGYVHVYLTDHCIVIKTLLNELRIIDNDGEYNTLKNPLYVSHQTKHGMECSSSPVIRIIVNECNYGCNYLLISYFKCCSRSSLSLKEVVDDYGLHDIICLTRSTHVQIHVSRHHAKREGRPARVYTTVLVIMRGYHQCDNHNCTT